MDLYFSDVFQVDPDILEEYGAFNVSLINDLPLFIDPFLLFNSPNEAYQRLHNDMIAYLRFLRDRAESDTITEGLLRNWFIFSEVKQNWLGYSRTGNRGSGLGIDFARTLHRNLHTLFSDFGSEAITRSSHLEKLCLIRDGVGRDNISDFTTNLIKEHLLDYTQAFSREHLAPEQLRTVAVSRVRFNYETRSWETRRYQLPFHDGDWVILTPKDLLTKDETWINKPDLVDRFHDVADSIPNIELRAQVNEYFLRCLPKEPTRPDFRAAVSQVISRYPQLIDYYIRQKEDHGDEAVTLSEQRVREVEALFIRDLTDFVKRLHQESGFYTARGNTLEEARARVLFLKDVIENKGGHTLFYRGDEPIGRERDVQILFRLTWFATPSDISREVDDGRGPVDFKVSRGARDKSLVEFKLAKNTHLRRNLEKQVAIYEKASDAQRSLRVVVFFTDEELARVEAILRELDLKSSPDVILIDARASNKPSGSRA